MDAPLEVVFEIVGDPVPQPRPRYAKRGAFVKVYIESDHEIHAYRQAVEIQAKVHARRQKLTATKDPHELEVVAIFSRPKSHFRPDGTLGKSARAFPPRGDWDNLGKGICDAITDSAAWWLDDSQVVEGRVRKRYAGPDERARTIVTIRRLA